MVHCYTSKKMVWVKVAFILIEYGGEETESQSPQSSTNGFIIPKQSLCSNALTPRIKPQVNVGFLNCELHNKNQGHKVDRSENCS